MRRATCARSAWCCRWSTRRPTSTPRRRSNCCWCSKADPNDATANNDLGYQWADQSKNLAEAERMIRKALELDHKQRTSGDALAPDADQDNAAYVDSLGWVLFRRGKLGRRPQGTGEGGVPAGRHRRRRRSGTTWATSISAREMPAKAGEAWRKAVGLYETTRRRPDDRLPRDQGEASAAETVNASGWSTADGDYGDARRLTAPPTRQLATMHLDEETPCPAIPTGRRSSTRRGPSTPSAASCGAS